MIPEQIARADGPPKLNKYGLEGEVSFPIGNGRDSGKVDLHISVCLLGKGGGVRDRSGRHRGG